MSTEETKDNGFLDRMLLSFPDAKIEEYNENELDYETIKWYSESIIKMYQTFKKETKRNENGDIEKQKANQSARSHDIPIPRNYYVALHN